MSGGAFDYNQNRITYIIEEIEQVIEKNGKPLTEREMKENWGYRDPSWYDKYPEDKFHIKYSDEVIEKFKDGLEHLKKAYIYAQRIDWLLSDDDGEDSFLRRLEEELKDLIIENIISR